VPANFTNPTVTAVWRNSDQDLNLAAQLVKQFGSVRTLSSPRITVTNNQTAVLKVAQNQIFFDLQVEREQATAAGLPDRVTVESEIKTVPVGLVMNVQPSIDPVSRRITMNLRPSITRITGFVPDPGVAIIVAQVNAESNAGINVSSQIPVIEVREMDSLVSISSGETLIMGGLMQETAENTREGIPGAMDVPIIGPAFGQNIRANTVTELVIFLRATIVNDRDSVTTEDIRLYKTFTPDPRPLVF
jgi:general secretion pathway protein D